jgi:site-specific recombinase XerD
VPTGASIEAMQRMLGHASAAMTPDVYGGLHDDDLEQLADRFEANRILPGHRGGTGEHG